MADIIVLAVVALSAVLLCWAALYAWLNAQLSKDLERSYARGFRPEDFVQAVVRVGERVSGVIVDTLEGTKDFLTETTKKFLEKSTELQPRLDAEESQTR